MCLNVYGSLELKLGCQEVGEIMNEYDIVFFSETWTNEFSKLDVKGFKKFCKHRLRVKNAKRDSGGLVVYFKEHIVKGAKEIEWDFEDVLNYAKGFFGWNQDLYMHFVYLKPVSSTRENINVGVDGFEKLFEQISKFSSEGSNMILGDLNSRVGENQECKIINIDNDDISEELFTLPSEVFENVFTIDDFVDNGMTVKRTNKDTVINQHGKQLLQLTIACD